jgi:hypothetical protein
MKLVQPWSSKWTKTIAIIVLVEILCNFLTVNAKALSWTALGEHAIKITSLQPAHPTNVEVEQLDWYAASLAKSIVKHWKPPCSEGGAAVIGFDLSSDGAISRVRLEKTSGVDIWDRAALNSIVNFAPFERLPTGIKFVHVEVSFGFNMSKPGRFTD